MSAFKLIRISILLLILAGVWKHFDSQKQLVQNWNGTQDVVIIPIQYDDESQTKKAIKQLTESQFSELNRYLAKEAKRYDLNLNHSIRVSLSEPVNSLPPGTPKYDSSKLDILLWSLKLRWWSYQNKPSNFHDGQVRLFVMYSSPEKDELLPHSTGLQKGLLGLIHASAHREDLRKNNMVIMHELLHIFGAFDKYDLRTGHPIFPNGFASPNQTRPYPQNRAEIMAGRIPVSKSEFRGVNGLSQTIIGEQTAKEIGWISSNQ